MGHVFDTGATSPQRTRLRQGAVSLLAGLKLPVGYLAAVIPWGQVVRSYTDEVGVAQLVDTLAARSPSIAVAMGDRDDTTAAIGGFQSKGEIELFLYFCSANARDQLVGRLEIDSRGLVDDHADPGIEVTMEHAKELLIGQRCGGVLQQTKQIRPVREQELYTGTQCTIWLQTYKILIETHVSEWRTVTQLLTSIRSRVSTNPAEVPPPAAKVDPTSIDFNTDGLHA